MNKMEIVYIDINDLKPYKHNPRRNDEAVQVVANSIKEFGFKVPIVIDTKNEIVAGHTRIKAALSLGLTSVPCIIADDLNEAQIRAFRLADNKVAELSAWDLDLLNLELTEIELDMSEFGFETFDMEDFGTDFNLPDGDKSNLEQITFTLANEQAETVREALQTARGGSLEYDNFGNDNSNGNALYGIVTEWLNRQ